DVVSTIESSDVAAVTLERLPTERLLRHDREEPSPLAVLLSTLGSVLCDWLEIETATIHLERHGRDASSLGCDLDVTRTVGWFTALHPFELGSDDAFSVQQRLDSVPAGGLSFGVLRGSFQGDPRPQMAFNFLGVTDATNESGVRRLTPPGHLNSPHNQRPHLIDINSWVTEGRMHIEWTFDSGIHQAGDIRKLAERYVGELAACLDDVRGTSSPEAREDAMAGLDQADLKNILDQVRFNDDE
ncbi:MAG: hypothetical protein AAF497_18205, partial [Planctomycetota bacterium]